ncbi:SAM-dependent methyltransferase [Azospirillum canadense]|uniref:SAM-dependent methyltransferase n=1 Tax=Azospirillum canadense TaxID=403962 RepID=UPI0022277DE9|nr:cyclopropane-fatty-acyl-phospholipid synthase family protein [Azospirillum canadense]MCW2241674.1 cyclopropane-fatty-acyl-phospholipid synthase [Azospirillum canadense]
MLLAYMLEKFVQRGRLTVIDAFGQTRRFGGGPGPVATIRLHDEALHRRLFLNPQLAVGEAYMDGTLTVEEGSLYDFLALAMSNLATPPRSIFTPLWSGFGTLFRRWHQHNPVGRSMRNVAHHYDLSDDLYALFLDSDRQYSCAYFENSDDDLEVAQLRKKRHIAAKLRLEPGMRVLDIGSGWGGLALYLARETGVEVTGLTLSVEQHKVATERARIAGLADRVRFHLRDYREDAGQYDRIVSVGMFEHVGVGHFQAFFNTVHHLLAKDGVAMPHAIGRFESPGTTNAWLRKYIFPGGYAPALSEVLAPVERAGLCVTDVEILRLHYAFTLRHWRERFMARWNDAKALYDERFCRMWEFYLTGCEVSFRVGGMMVFQIQMAKAVDAVPITRGYMDAWERAHPLPARPRI